MKPLLQYVISVGQYSSSFAYFRYIVPSIKAVIHLDRVY